MTNDTTRQSTGTTGRIATIDIARGAALVAMAIYHFAWDLEFFGYVPPAMTAVGGWKLFARCIASSFLFLVGVSLFLGHSQGIRWRGYRRRLAMVAGAALAISAVTYIAVPNGFLEDRTAYNWEVLAIERSGNQTLSSGSFETG